MEKRTRGNDNYLLSLISQPSANSVYQSLRARFSGRAQEEKEEEEDGAGRWPPVAGGLWSWMRLRGVGKGTALPSLSHMISPASFRVMGTPTRKKCCLQAQSSMSSVISMKRALVLFSCPKRRSFQGMQPSSDPPNLLPESAQVQSGRGAVVQCRD